MLACILMSSYITYTFCSSLPPSLLSVELDPSVSNNEVEGECTTHCLRFHVLYMLCCAPTPCAFTSPCCKLVCLPVCTCILMVHIDLHLYLCLYTILYLHSPLLVKEGSTNPPGPTPVPVAAIVCGVLAVVVVVVGLGELCCCSSCSNRHLWAQCQCTVMTAQ